MNYEMSRDAVRDLDEIFFYTMEMWGEDEVDKYVGILKDKLEAIGRGDVIKSKYGGKFANLYVIKFRLHSIYYKIREGREPVNARILHDKQDRVRHLKKTTNESELDS